MRVTLLGHASVLVEMTGAVCLMDPVFFDPFEEGAVVSCPARAVHVDKLPAIDLLVVSHRHPDHSDIASLARLPRDCDAICPADPLIVYGLKQLGFKRVHPVEPMGEISSADFELYPTRSETTSLREFGMVFRDRGGVFFNKVDIFVSDATIQAIRDRFGQVDLLLAMYASQNFEFFESRTTDFPYATHRRNLETALAIAPRMVAPGSAGFRFTGDHSWFNAFLFPISAQRFVDDLRRLDPAMEASLMGPGDVFEIGGDGVRYLPGASPYAATLCDDRSLIEFDPTAPIPPLSDPNVDGWSSAKLEQLTQSFVGEQMGQFVLAEQSRNDPVSRCSRWRCRTC
jgi:UDP-MurNAc hydroxylase